MAAETLGTERRAGAIWNDQRFRNLLVQALVIGILGAVIAYLVNNTLYNLDQRGIATGFGFLSVPSGFDVAWSLIPYDRHSTHGDVFVVGLLNTLLVSAIGCVCATILGLVIGVLRLSHNWLVSRLAYWYVEILRNIPLLLQILFWYALLITSSPAVRNSVSFGDIAYFNNRGLTMPMPVFEPGFSLVVIGFLAACVGSWFLARWSRKRQEATGQIFPVLLTSLGALVLLPLFGALLAGFPLSWNYPELKGFNFVGGLTIKPEFVCLWFALTVYTSAFIAEIVRAGILSVSHGQTEAAYALGLRPSWTMRLILIPQALRVIVPPLTSNYLNLTKNSSLAVAIGYPDLVATFSGTSLNQTGQAVEIIGITMAVYLTISLIISAFMNWYNRKVALVER